MVLDEVFGLEKFVNQLCWRRTLSATMRDAIFKVQNDMTGYCMIRSLYYTNCQYSEKYGTLNISHSQSTQIEQQ